MSTKLIKSPQDLRTTHDATRRGFLRQAEVKTKEAMPYVQNAKAFYRALKSAPTIESIVSLTEFRNDLIAACGFSDKAKARLTDKEIDQSIQTVLIEIQRIAGNEFREEILYRYLLTRGDSLGGSTRNITGAAAGIKLVNLIADHLQSAGKEVYLSKTPTGKISRIAWEGRVLKFDVTPKMLKNSNNLRTLKNNIDVVLLKSGEENDKKADMRLLGNKENYIACGELKGGIDPAGADEHWKTANSALGRIRQAFDKPPSLFFVGAAIEASMAEEIYDQLNDGRLNFAANLTKDDQLEDLVSWLITL